MGVDEYERTLRPALLDQYAAEGYCWVVIGSLQAGRSFAQPKIAPQAIAYYAQLANQAKLVYHVSPFARQPPRGPVQLRLVDRLLPGAIRRGRGPRSASTDLQSGKCAPNYSAKHT